ncbi:MAG: hypothetical protein D6715_09300 [Calditrichaeota bacterium]|nr:MAG: hypothetical protein D6715_09300 [Calditrichota bacterium]
MGTILDLLGAQFIGGMILLLALVLTDQGVRQFLNMNSDAIVQQNLTQVSDIMEKDFRKMGYAIDEAKRGDIVQVADSSKIRFLAQLNLDFDYYQSLHGNLHKDDIPDTIEYRVEPFHAYTLGDTTIQLYKLTRRVVVSQEGTEEMSVGNIANPAVFRYFDQDRNPTAVLQAIRIVEITLTAYEPEIMLSPEMVMESVNQGDKTFKRNELMRLLRPAYWRQTKLVSKNLKR